VRGLAELPTIGWLSDPEHWLSIAEPVALFHRIGWLRHPGIFTDRRKNTLMRYMTLLIPYAVLVGTSEKLKEIASTENLLSDEDKNDLVYFLGVE